MIMRFWRKNDDLVVCSMVALFGGHMIKKIGKKVGQHKLSLQKPILKNICVIYL